MKVNFRCIVIPLATEFRGWKSNIYQVFLVKEGEAGSCLNYDPPAGEAGFFDLGDYYDYELHDGGLMPYPINAAILVQF